ncbi:DUF2332 domain-containing protein [Phenylobacterium aquaticum]|uniref:DUF2332 domain-containing protein n=1 Tax=Phenylobacterium aquaticum TaxID=1763816 RepID=UPI0026EBF0B0|nr:DUF2332 family protein [Phenylobacterium aquaticum]
MTANPDLVRNLRLQAKACGNLGSPFNAGLLELAADDLDAGGPTTALLAPWATASLKTAFDDATALRLVGGLHDLVLSGDAPDLAALYPAPDRPGDPARAWPAAQEAMIAHRDRLIAFLDHEPQTNEVRRSVCLAPGFLTLAAETGLPIRAFEIAASAGLNLNWDRYHYQFGDAAWGDPAAAVQLDTDWTGPAPPVAAKVEIIERAACDRRPVDLTDPLMRRRLLAYVWPDQFERLARIRAAIDLALALEVKVEAADAVAWTAAHAAPRAGAVTCLYHSVFWQYMPAASQAAMARTIDDLGAQATARGPFAWLRMEPDPGNMAQMQVRLTLWPTGEERILAVVHPHGAFVNWLG